MSNFQDGARQEAIDLLLSNSPILQSTQHQTVKAGLKERISQYSSKSNLLLYCGTYNFNGRTQPDALESWLTSNNVGRADIAVIGCQELIQLTPNEVSPIEIDV